MINNQGQGLSLGSTVIFLNLPPHTLLSNYGRNRCWLSFINQHSKKAHITIHIHTYITIIRVFFIGSQQHKLKNHYLDFCFLSTCSTELWRLKLMFSFSYSSFLPRMLFIAPGGSALGIMNHCFLSLLVSNNVSYWLANHFLGWIKPMGTFCVKSKSVNYRASCIIWGLH